MILFFSFNITEFTARMDCKDRYLQLPCSWWAFAVKVFISAPTCASTARIEQLWWSQWDYYYY